MAHLVFVGSPTGYELLVREGDVPEVGDELEVEDTRVRVTKVTASPLPQDERRCAFVLPVD